MNQREQVFEALKRIGPVASVEQLAVESGVPRASVPVILQRLSAESRLHRIGRGLVALQAPPSWRSHGAILSADARSIADALERAGLDFSISGPDALAGYEDQLPVGGLHLVLVAHGAGEWALDALRPLGFAGLLNPSSDQLQAANSVAQSGLVVIREQGMSEVDRPIQKPEAAWADLAAEAARGFPVSFGELVSMLEAMSSDAGISWSRLVRSARRRSLPLALAPGRPIPVRGLERAGKWRELINALEDAQ